MAHKLPVGATLNEAFQFGLHRWGTVIRFAWLPVVVMVLLFGLFFVATVDFTKIEGLDETAGFDELKELMRLPLSMTILVGLMIYVAIGFLMSGVAASIFRLVALGEERPGLFHLRLDGPAKRVFFAYMITSILGLLIYVVAGAIALMLSDQSIGGVIGGFMSFINLAVEAENSGAELTPEQIKPFLDGFAFFGWMILISIIPAIYISIKLIAFAPGSAAENRLFMMGSFGLTSGNFWRILGTIILFALALVLISFIFEIVSAILQLLSGYLTEQGVALTIVGAILGIVMVALSIFYNAFAYGVQLSLPAIIYRRLKTGE